MKHKIMLVGGYSYQDTGDESQLTASLESLKLLLPDAAFLVLSDNPEHTREYHKVTSAFSIRQCFVGSLVPRRQPEKSMVVKNVANSGFFNVFLRVASGIKTIAVSLLLIFNATLIKRNKKTFFLDKNQRVFLNNLKTSDLLFGVGGGNLTSVWHSEFYLKCLTFILCRIFGLPVVLSGQTIGPINGKIDSCIAKYALNGVNVITLRENASVPTLKRIGVNRPVIRVTADDSVQLMPAPISVLNKIISNEYLMTRRPIIGMNIFGLPLQCSETNFLNAKKLLAYISDYLVERYNATIVFVPMQYGDIDDRIAESETIALMKRRENAFLLSGVHTDSEIKGLVGQMDFVIGFRYHFITFAVTSGVPAIGIYSNPYYSKKICGVLALMGLEDNAFDLKKINYADFIVSIDKCLASEKSVRDSLVYQTESLRAKSLLSVKYAISILNRNM
jgi:polysaccharide pyruvyl transferase WcaK-like protein